MDVVIPRMPPSHWLLKNFRALAGDPLGFMSKSREMYGNLVDMNISPWVNVYLVTDPDVVKHILIDNQRNYKKAFAYNFLKEALGNGLLTNEGESWLRQRRIAQPAFHRERLANLADGMKDGIEKMFERWKGFRGSDKLFDVAGEFMKLTSEITARALFSSDIGELKDEITDSITIINQFIMEKISTPFRIPLWVPVSKNRLFNKTIKKLDTIIYNIIEARRKSTHVYHDLLTMLIEAKDGETGESMNDLQLRDEVMTLFLAGSETSSNTLAWTFFLLAKDPEVKNRMNEEIKNELGAESPNSENILRLKYTSMVIQESMRLYPPAWVIGREALKEDHIKGYKIKKRSQMYMSVFTIHHHPELWEEPEKFDPLRFTPEKIKQRHKFSYLPFGAGPRFCIGNNFAIMEITIALVLAAQQNINLKLTDLPVDLEPLITLRPYKGLWMTL